MAAAPIVTRLCLSIGLLALVLPLAQRILTVRQATEAMVEGFRSMMLACLVLVLAWSMSDVTTALNAKGYLISILGESMPAAWVPAAVFVLAGITAFAHAGAEAAGGALIALARGDRRAREPPQGLSDVEVQTHKMRQRITRKPECTRFKAEHLLY